MHFHRPSPGCTDQGPPFSPGQRQERVAGNRSCSATQQCDAQPLAKASGSFHACPRCTATACRRGGHLGSRVAARGCCSHMQEPRVALCTRHEPRAGSAAASSCTQQSRGFLKQLLPLGAIQPQGVIRRTRAKTPAALLPGALLALQKTLTRPKGGHAPADLHPLLRHGVIRTPLLIILGAGRGGSAALLHTSQQDTPSRISSTLALCTPSPPAWHPCSRARELLAIGFSNRSRFIWAAAAFGSQGNPPAAQTSQSGPKKPRQCPAP